MPLLRPPRADDNRPSDCWLLSPKLAIGLERRECARDPLPDDARPREVEVA